MLTLLVLAPLLGAVVVSLIPARRRELHLPLGMALSVAPLGLAGAVFFTFEAGRPPSRWSRRWCGGNRGGCHGNWVWTVSPWGWWFSQPSCSPFSLAVSDSISHRRKAFVVAMLFLETGLIGTFLAMDLLLFFVFFEVILVPMYLIIGVWGGERRVYAAVKFFIYTAFGSALAAGGDHRPGGHACLSDTGRPAQL